MNNTEIVVLLVEVGIVALGALIYAIKAIR